MNKIRAIQFVDGENLAMRYQALLGSGRVRKNDVVHRKDVYVWHDSMSRDFHRGFTHIYYYTSIVGDPDAVTRVKNELSAIRYTYEPMLANGPRLQLIPVVFKRSARNQKQKNVDIQIVIDVMRAKENQACDMILLASGDGDYLPLVEEVMRSGKQVCVAAFSSGLNQQLKHAVSKFIDLDPLFFYPQT